MSDNMIKVVNIGRFGFWLFLMTLIICLTYVYLRTPSSLIREYMTIPSQEEVLIKQLRDPLAIRLYALKRVLNELPAQTPGSTYQSIIDGVVKQWADEVGLLKASAYHLDEKWDVSKLPLNQEQKSALLEVSGGVK